MPRTSSKNTGKSGAKVSTPKKYKAYKTVAAAAVVSSSAPAAPTASTAPPAEVASGSGASPDDHIFVPVLARDDLMNELSEADVEQQLSELGDIGAGQLIPRKATATKTVTAYALASTMPATNFSAAPAPAMPASPDDHIFVPLARSDQDIKDQLGAILAQAGAMLGQVCEDNGSGEIAGNLALCSWETAMKEYILTFP